MEESNDQNDSPNEASSPTRQEILAIIPARGGSKGLPGKNILPVGGVPMICRVIKEGLSSDLISRIIVSSDSDEIISQALSDGAEVLFKRPKELSTDTAGISGVVEHALKWLSEETKYHPEIIVLLQANSPFNNSIVIDECINKLIETESDVVYTVSSVEHPPFWVQTLNEDGSPKFVFPNEMIPKHLFRQMMPQTYRPTGAVSVLKAKYVKQCFDNLKTPGFHLPISGQKTRAVKTDQITSIDVDNHLDYLFANAVHNEVKNNHKKRI